MRHLVAEARYQAERRTQMAFDKALDVVVTALIGRATVRRLVDDIVDYIAVQPVVREIVQSQGAHLTDEVIDETRQNLFRADAVVEQLVSTARRRLRFARRQRPSTKRAR